MNSVEAEWPEVEYLYPMSLTLLHSEWPKLHSFGHSECNRVKAPNVHAQHKQRELSQIYSSTSYMANCGAESAGRSRDCAPISSSNDWKTLSTQQ